jgi:putative ABC transport system permease protein
MSIFQILRMATGALSANRARSTLTVLSITIGAFAIVVMSSLAESGLLTLSKGVEDLGGARIIMVWQKWPEKGENKQFAYARGLSLADRERVFEGIPHVAGVSLYKSLGPQEVTAESGARATTSVLAADARFVDVFRLRIARGRAFTEDENRGREAVCIVGPKLAEKIGPAPTDPLGRFLTVGSVRCRIEGVFADNERFGVRFGFDWNDLVVVPSETMGDRDRSVQEWGQMIVQTDAPASNDLVKRLISARLSARHPGLDDFGLFDFNGMMESWKKIDQAMQLIVAVLAGIALFVGGVGVMNMMLVAVSERVKEIGIRKALGARPRAIGAQFLTEAVFLSTLGGTTGVITGLGVALLASTLLARSISTWQVSLAPWAAISALVVTMLIGIGFGWLPARKAASLDPIEAMRR